ncbi:ABC transporter permease [Archangium sp.]|jgi:ABC-type Na+ efflux pump permease subunit|uniref:ABC transporter permease n=1 Tax=Archangium sp. TaxID=1872627 RepID=UPI002ED9B767
MQATLRRYRLLEARHAVGWVPLVSLLVGLAIVVFTAWLMPLFPTPVITFMERAFLIRGMGAVILVNEYIGIYLLVFFGGVTGLMRALVEPRENRSLELLLSKPISRRTFLMARVGPILLAATALGVVLCLLLGLVVRPFTGEGSNVSVAGAIGAGLIFTALAVLLLCVLVVPLLLVRDAFQGLLIAFVTWIVPLFPTAVLLYRPDLYEGRDWLRDMIVLGPNLLWYDAAVPRLTAIALAVAFVGSWGALVLGTRMFERAELR